MQPGQIYESNGPMLAAAVREAGGEATLLRFVPDDVEAFHAALAPHLASTDLLIDLKQLHRDMQLASEERKRSGQA